MRAWSFYFSFCFFLSFSSFFLSSTIGIHGVVNCAGVAIPKRVVSGRGTVHDMETFNFVLNVNVAGTFNVLKQAVAIMLKQPADADGERGAIINVASVAAYEGQVGQAAYAASKGAVVSMSLPIARELCTQGIRVNVIAPGIMGTPMLKALPMANQVSLTKDVLFPKRMGEVSEFSRLCVHMFENHYINATVFRMDAGLRMSAL